MTILLRFHGYNFPVIYRRHCLVAEVQSSSFSNLSVLSFVMFPESRYKDCAVDVAVWVNYSVLDYSLIFDQFGISVMVSTCSKNKPL